MLMLKFFAPIFQVQLMSLAVNVDAAKINKTIFDTFSKEKDNGANEVSSEEIVTSTPKGITKKDLEELETMLSKELTHEQTKHAMRILRGFRSGATPQEKEAALVSACLLFLNFLTIIHVLYFILLQVDLFTSALNGVFGGHREEVTNNDSSQSNEL